MKLEYQLFFEENAQISEQLKELTEHFNRTFPEDKKTGKEIVEMLVEFFGE